MLNDRGQPVRRALRQNASQFDNAVDVGEIDGTTDWHEALKGIDTVIHLAGRAHILKETSANPLSEFRRINVQGTLRLAKQMIECGCRRLVFVSTVGVNGNATPIDRPFTESSLPTPQMPYAIAKWEAEQELKKLKAQLEIVIVRPPLVYGSGAPGNFGRLLKLVQQGIPLPFAAVKNRRSLVAVQNLCDFLICCAESPAAAGETFLISDGEDLSISELMRRIGRALDKPVRLFPFPEALLRIPLRIAGREHMFNQLFGSLVVDSSKARQHLAWHPPLSVDQALASIRESAV